MNNNFFVVFGVELHNCIYEFAQQINQGFGWISEKDVIIQFLNKYPEFKNPIIDKNWLEQNIIGVLKTYVVVKK